ncbi:MAG: hypothetical protein VW405_07095 [Rhodospirillaceae bacterium]
MVDFQTVNTAISVTREAQGVIAVGRSAAAQRVGAVELDAALTPSRFDEARVELGAAEARSTVAIAVVAGKGIVSALKGLASSAALAQHESLVSNLTNLEIGGTRVSRLNLTTGTNRALALIDRLVAGTETNNANFIASNAGPIVVKTSGFGGAIRVTPQPLDTTGLNLRGISLLTGDAAADAEARLLTAINTAERRVIGLEGLKRALSAGNFTSSSLDGLVSSLSGGGLPLGTLVNVVG